MDTVECRSKRLNSAVVVRRHVLKSAMATDVRNIAEYLALPGAVACRWWTQSREASNFVVLLGPWELGLILFLGVGFELLCDMLGVIFERATDPANPDVQVPLSSTFVVVLVMMALAYLSTSL